MDLIYEALNYLYSVFHLILDFILDIPTFLHAFSNYFIYLAMSLYIDFKIASVKTAHTIATQLLTDYEVYQIIGSAFNSLPSSLKYASHEFGVVEAIRIIVDAYGTAFVLRFLNN